MQDVENLATLILDSRTEGMQQGHAPCVGVLSRWLKLQSGLLLKPR